MQHEACQISLPLRPEPWQAHFYHKDLVRSYFGPALAGSRKYVRSPGTTGVKRPWDKKTGESKESAVWWNSLPAPRRTVSRKLEIREAFRRVGAVELAERTGRDAQPVTAAHDACQAARSGSARLRPQRLRREEAPTGSLRAPHRFFQRRLFGR
jgi:hypothetical protein